MEPLLVKPRLGDQRPVFLLPGERPPDEIEIQIDEGGQEVPRGSDDIGDSLFPVQDEEISDIRGHADFGGNSQLSARLAAADSGSERFQVDAVRGDQDPGRVYAAGTEILLNPAGGDHQPVDFFCGTETKTATPHGKVVRFVHRLRFDPPEEKEQQEKGERITGINDIE